jgi:hypothetical protein
MHRKPQLQEAARKLQEIVNARTGDLSYAQALDILSQLEGFEGYRHLRDFVSRHSQSERLAVQDPKPALTLAPANIVTVQTLAMALCGHLGFDDAGRRIQAPQEELFGVYIAHNYWETSLDNHLTVIRQLADRDAGAPVDVNMLPSDIAIVVEGSSLSEFHITVNELITAKYVSEGRWQVGSRVLRFNTRKGTLVPALFARYIPRPGQNLSLAEHIQLEEKLERYDLAHAMGQETDEMYTHRDEINRLLDSSPWARDMDSGKIVHHTQTEYGNHKHWERRMPWSKE